MLSYAYNPWRMWHCTCRSAARLSSPNIYTKLIVVLIIITACHVCSSGVSATTYSIDNDNVKDDRDNQLSLGRRHRLVEHREKIKSILHDENTYNNDISEFTASDEDMILNDGNNKEEGKGEESEVSFISRLLKKKKKGLLQKKLGRDIARINQRTVNKKKVDNRTGGKKIKIQSPSHKKKKNKKSMTKEKPMNQKKKKEERWGAGNHNKWSVSWSSKYGKRSKGGKSKGSKGGWGDDCTCIKWGDEWYSASKSAKTKLNRNHQCKKWKCNNGWGKSSSKDSGWWNP